jgi:hypothetical protein
VGSTSYHNLLQLDVIGIGANRGQPVINKYGELVGMVTGLRGGSAFVLPVAGFDNEAKSWAKSGRHINVGPPLVTANASTLLVPSAEIPGGFQQTKSEPWGISGYHVAYVKQPTYTDGGETIDSYVFVETSEAFATSDYRRDMDAAAKSRHQVASGDIADASTTWLGQSLAEAVYEVIWRDRNVESVMYWGAGLPNSEISQARLEALAAAQEALISADLAAYQSPA